jgi:hypothetical protein
VREREEEVHDEASRVYQAVLIFFEELIPHLLEYFEIIEAEQHYNQGDYKFVLGHKKQEWVPRINDRSREKTSGREKLRRQKISSYKGRGT